jgi:hypothetical protein
MTEKLLMFLCACFLGTVQLAVAQTPSLPVAVPSGCGAAADNASQSSKTDLNHRHDALMKRFQQWKVRADNFNQRYTGREFDADSREAKDGASEQAWLSQEAQDYVHAAKVFKSDVDKFSALNGPANEQPCSESTPTVDPEGVRVINAINALAKKLKWTADKLARLDTALHKLSADGDPNSTAVQIRSTWQGIIARGQDADLVREASEGGGLGFPGAGTQTVNNDCTVFALANAAGLPYGAVAARATELIHQGDWRGADERANPQAVIERHGLNGGEVVMLAEAFGQAEVVASSDFAKTLHAGRPVMINVIPADGNMRSGHEVVLTKTFQHRGETWFEMMDSNQGPQRRLFLSSSELNTMLQENGVSYRPDPGTTPKLIRNSGDS